jgi:8-oxo-dGTP pyrophosphatase MutT (NUDIX family)
MHENELWQVFNNNGTPVPNKGATKDEFKKNPAMIMGNSHIWLWKKSGDQIEILLQKRAITKPTKPGMYHISAGGHINVGETNVEAALRETKEEMGIDLDENQLHYVCSTRIVATSPNSIVNVFLYELQGDEEFVLIDGEVDSYEWQPLDNFKKIVESADASNLVNQGMLYFYTLIDALEHITLGTKTLR